MTCTSEICWSDKICYHSYLVWTVVIIMAMTCTSEICWSDKICCHSILSEQLLYGYGMYIRNMLIWQNLLPLYLVWTVVIIMAMTCTSEICWSDKICCHSILSEQLLYGYDMYIRNMLIWQNLLPLYLVWTVVIWLWHVHHKYTDLTKFAATLSCLNSCYMAMACTPKILNALVRELTSIYCTLCLSRKSEAILFS